MSAPTSPVVEHLHLRSYVPRLAAEWIATEPETRHRCVEGTLVFVDISGFTALTERLTRHGIVGAEEITDILDGTFAEILQHALRAGGDLLKWGGDAVLLLFRGPHHAVRAVRAAMDMRSQLRAAGRSRSTAGQVTLRMSVGVHSGPVDLFLVGDPGAHRELVVSGPGASLTAQMEATASAGQILVSEATARLLEPGSLGEVLGEGRLVRRRPAPAPLPDPTPDAEIDVSVLIPRAVRKHLVAAAGESEHRTVVVAFVKFSGTDALLREAGPEDVAAALDALVRNAQDACARNRVTFLASDIDRDGGKIILVAGAPEGGRYPEDRLLRAARLVVDRAGSLPLRIGVNRGAVFAGDFGPDVRKTYTIMGDTVNLAARVMSRAPAGEVLATPEVVARTQSHVEVTELEPFRVKGKALPVRALSVACVAGESEATHASSRTEHRAPAGRERELALAASVLTRSLSGSGGAIEISADAGLGKSSFAEYVCALSPNHRVLHGPSGRLGGTSAFHAIRRLLRDASGASAGMARSEQLALLRNQLETLHPELLGWLPLLAAVLDISVPDTEQTRDLDERLRGAKTVEVVVDFLRASCPSPTVLLFEDADEMDTSSMQVADALVAATEDRPWVVMTTRTHDDTGYRISGDGVTRIDLAPLDLEASLALLQDWTEDDPVSPHLLRAIAQKAGGNPLFLDALLGAARERGTVADLPDSIGGVVTGQVDRLAPRDRAVLRFAAVLGDQFSLTALRDLVATEGWTLEDDDLVRLGRFLEATEAGSTWWRFSNAVIRDAAYAGLPFRLRRRMHRHAGLVLEAADGDASEKAEQLATHFFEAGDRERTWTYARAAGDRARGLHLYPAAIELYTWAVAAGVRVEGVEPSEIAQTLQCLGEASDLAGLSPRAIEAYRQARRWTRDAPLARASLMAKEAALLQRVGELGRALRVISYASRLAAGPQPEAASVRAQLAARRSFINYVHSRHAEALRWSAVGLEEARASGAPSDLAYAYMVRDLTLAAAGQPSDEKYGELALAMYEKSGDLSMQARCLTNLGIRAFQEGQWHQAVSLTEKASDLFRRVGDTAREALTTYNLGGMLIRQRRFDVAEARLVEARRLARVADDVELLALIAQESGRALLGLRRLPEALATLEEARDGLTAAGLDHELLEVRADLAQVRAEEGDAAGAVQAMACVMEDATALGGVTTMASLHYSHGLVLARAGRWHEAEHAFGAGRAAGGSSDGGWARAVNGLGLALVARVCSDGRRSVGPSVTEDLAVLRRLGVLVDGLPGARTTLTDGERASTPDMRDAGPTPHGGTGIHAR